MSDIESAMNQLSTTGKNSVFEEILANIGSEFSSRGFNPAGKGLDEFFLDIREKTCCSGVFNDTINMIRVLSDIDKQIDQCLDNGEIDVFYMGWKFYTSDRMFSTDAFGYRDGSKNHLYDEFWKLVREMGKGRRIGITCEYRTLVGFQTLGEFIKAVNVNDIGFKATPEMVLGCFLDLEKMNKYFTINTVSSFWIDFGDGKRGCGFDGNLDGVVRDAIETGPILPVGYHSWINRESVKPINLPASVDNEIKFKVWCAVVKSIKITEKSLKEIIGWVDKDSPCNRLGKFPIECLTFILSNNNGISGKKYFRHIHQFIGYKYLGSEHRMISRLVVVDGSDAIKSDS